MNGEDRHRVGMLGICPFEPFQGGVRFAKADVCERNAERRHIFLLQQQFKIGDDLFGVFRLAVGRESVAECGYDPRFIFDRSGAFEFGNGVEAY